MGWGGRWQKPCFGHPMSSHDTHTVANDTPVGQTQIPTAQLAPSVDAIDPAMTLESWQNAL